MSQIQALGAANGGGGANTFVTDAGNAVPAAGIINILGSHGINTSGAGNTVTIAINNAITLGDLSAIATGSSALTATTGDITITSGNLNMANTSAAGADGVINLNAVRFMHNFGGVLPDQGNTFLGQNAGNFTLTAGVAFENTGIGCQSLRSLTTGAANVACGNQALQSLTSSSNNTAVGENSLFTLSTGSGRNLGLGNNALGLLQTGAFNSALGTSSLGQISGAASDNIAIGYQSAFNYTGVESSNIIIGNLGTLGESNVIRIGTQGAGAAQQNACYVAGIVGVTVSNAASVRINTSTGQLGVGNGSTAGWSVITASPQAIAVNNGYISNLAGLITYTLPATSAVGDVFEITNINTALGWVITQSAGQQIRVGNVTSTLGAGGSVSSLALGDSIRCVCVVANTIWVAISYVGNLDII